MVRVFCAYDSIASQISQKLLCLPRPWQATVPLLDFAFQKAEGSSLKIHRGHRFPGTRGALEARTAFKPLP
jgi:hypothetical protein